MIVVPIYDMIILPGVTFYFKQDVFQELEIEDVKEGEELIFLYQKEDKERQSLTAEDFYPIGVEGKVEGIDRDGNINVRTFHRVDIHNIEVREQYPDVSVVCYVNSTAEIKALSDVCVTSSNALKIVKNLPNKDIFFIPDNNLGRYTAEQIPEKHFIFNDGFCHVHKSIHKEELLKAKEAKPEAVVVAHPECTPDVLEEADYIGSTSQIIDYVTESDKKEFIVCTEIGVFYELEQKNPEKKFYSVGHRQFCPNMKRISLEGVAQALETLEPEVELPEDLRVKAELPLKRMLEYAQK